MTNLYYEPSPEFLREKARLDAICELLREDIKMIRAANEVLRTELLVLEAEKICRGIAL